MRLFFSILSISYIAGVFLFANFPVISKLASFNPYSLLHIPLYAILTVLITFSFVPFRLKLNHPTNPINPTNASTHLHLDTSSFARFFIAGIIALGIAISDEIHQSFIPARDASIFDVFLDFVGVALTLFLFFQLHKKRKNQESALSNLHMNASTH